MVGLYNKPGRGSLPTFNTQQKERIREWAQQQPRQLKQVAQKIKEECSIEISTKTIKRILKTLSLSQARMCRGLGGEPNPQEDREKQAQLEEFQRLESEGLERLRDIAVYAA
jgi:transposase